jgi:hypothetical protein
VSRFTVRRLAWQDAEVGSIDLPAAPLRIRLSFGSGLARRASDPPGIVCAVGDRGPNLKAGTLVKRYGLERMRELQAVSGAKVMPRLDLGPAIARLAVHGDRVELLDTIKLTDQSGAPISGLPVPSSLHASCEPAFDLEGRPLDPDPSGLDTEGIAALAEGGFWIGDEFGPSLLRVDPVGRVLARHVPEGVNLTGARYPVKPSLPGLAGKRQLNRGFEAIALSEDEQWLFLAFQSPLAHPDEAAHQQARHVRLWRLAAADLSVSAQYLYPLDPPHSFTRDVVQGDLDWSDLKISELACLGGDRLLVLERGSQTTKIYRVDLSATCALPPDHLAVVTRPSVSGAHDLPQLGKELVFSTDDAPEVAADLEGMVVLSSSRLLLVNDNDFGVEGAETSFWTIDFDEPVLG